MGKRMMANYFKGIAASLMGFVLAGCLSNGLNEVVSPPPVSESPSPTPSPTEVATPSAADVAAASQARLQGLQLRNQGRYDDAIATLKKSVQLDPQNLSSYVILGWTQHLAGQETAAAQTLQQALERDPDHVPALNALGIVHLVSGDLQAAVATHTRAASLKPDNEIAYYNLSLAYQRLQQYDEAIAKATRATELEPGNPHPWVALAIAHWGKEDTAAANQAYQRAIQLDGRYRDRSFLSHLKKAGFSPDQIRTTEQVLTAL